MKRHCIPLHTAKKYGISKIGGKAINLSKMINAEFAVPMGFIVPVETYEEFFKNNELEKKILSCLEDLDFSDEKEIAKCSTNIKNMILNGHICDNIFEEISDPLNDYKLFLWAVRSSATAEDLPKASFAGQQDTYLNVKTEDIMAHIKLCWASYWNDRAISYRHHVNIPHSKGGIAVVIQKMIDSRTSGVMFTRNPVNKSSDDIIIESSWGLGESIVSGIVSPDRFTCKRFDGNIISEEISKKTKGIFLSTEQNQITKIEKNKQKTPSLTKDEISALVELGKRIETYFGCPQDVEWSIEDGKIHVLQSRPITTLEKDDGILWTRGYGDEYWADITSPLFFSLLGEYLTKYVNHEGAKIMGYHEITDAKLLRLHKGHIYFNAGVLEDIFTFNPKFSRTKELLNYFPESEQERIANAKTKKLRRIWAEIRIMIFDPDGSILKTDKAYRTWAEKYLKKMEKYDDLDLSQLTYEELHDQYILMFWSFVKHYRLIRHGMVTHSIGTNLMVKRWLTDWLGDTSGILYSKLISGLPDNKTIKTNMDMAKLADLIRENKDLSSILLEQDAEVFLETIRSNDKYLKQRAEFELFLKDYGHRSHTREIFFPRWKDDPSLVVDVLKSLVSSPKVDMDAMENNAVEGRLQCEKEVLESISKLKYGYFKKQLFKYVMRFAQTYLIFRENQRFYLDHIIYRLRRLFSEYGNRFVHQGIISDTEDIFFLSKEEIFSLAKNPSANMKAKISARKKEFKKYENILPPKFIQGRIEFDDTITREEDHIRVTGTSVSPGIVRGRIRVVSSIKHISSIKENEILVTSNTDPGWTPIFAKLAGLITETGGILSHGAVVSREYGIPAVTAVKNATVFFRTGQYATIDGNEGVIYLEEE
ncbi:MAG: PEP/pyruvate-binding domain-containing protein [Candidatus Methanofastidiosia archaeon]